MPSHAPYALPTWAISTPPIELMTTGEVVVCDSAGMAVWSRQCLWGDRLLCSANGSLSDCRSQTTITRSKIQQTVSNPQRSLHNMNVKFGRENMLHFQLVFRWSRIRCRSGDGFRARWILCFTYSPKTNALFVNWRSSVSMLSIFFGIPCYSPNSETCWNNTNYVS
jgi:hypothetical protein